jgi:predicted metalloprotease with PDZ domain
MASYDAWIKYYRSDENTPNTAISYYVKGAVVGFLLVANIRRMTGGARSLDDVMRAMFARFAAEKGFTGDDLRAAVVEIAGQAHAGEIRAWLERALATTTELDYVPATDWFGLQLTRAASPRSWLGVTTRSDGEQIVVTGVRRGSPAAAAGLSLLDEIVAVDGVRLAAGDLPSRLAELPPGARVRLSIARHGVEMPVDVTLGADPADGWTLRVSPGATRAQSQHLDAWLGR